MGDEQPLPVGHGFSLFAPLSGSWLCPAPPLVAALVGGPSIDIASVHSSRGGVTEMRGVGMVCFSLVKSCAESNEQREKKKNKTDVRDHNKLL